MYFYECYCFGCPAPGVADEHWMSADLAFQATTATVFVMEVENDCRLCVFYATAHVVDTGLVAPSNCETW